MANGAKLHKTWPLDKFSKVLYTELYLSDQNAKNELMSLFEGTPFSRDTFILLTIFITVCMG